MEKISSDTLTNLIVAANTTDLIAIFCNASWCQPGKIAATALAAAEAQLPDVTFIEIDIDECSATGQTLNVTNPPILLVMRRGNAVARQGGPTTTAKYVELIKGA